MYKGESFFECAKRKCFDEAGIDIEPKEILDVYSTTFVNSAWQTSTHTVNIAIFATCNKKSHKLDELHSDHKWISIYSASENVYVESIRQKIFKVIHY
jgi:ADP-ribose pyrophosphatase YjhB (NUDIX family)